MDQLKKWKWAYIALTLAVMLLGLCLILWPGISGEVLCYIFGGGLLVVGCVRIVSYFQRGISALWHRYEYPLGLLDALLGIYFLSRPANVLLLLPVIVGIAIVVDSVFKLQTALELRQMGVTRWVSMLVLAIVSIVFAILLLRNPFEGTMTLMVYLGLTLVIDSIQSLAFIHQLAKDVRKHMPLEAEYIDVE